MAKRRSSRTRAGTRRCPGCRKAKALTTRQWHRKTGSKDGFQGRCRECQKVSMREHRDRRAAAAGLLERVRDLANAVLEQRHARAYYIVAIEHIRDITLQGIPPTQQGTERPQKD